VQWAETDGLSAGQFAVLTEGKDKGKTENSFCSKTLKVSLRKL